ncbi:hypothetical protein PHYPSEUDO_012724 [Phytophthora pseudosyringae]|uniref:Uncharacterized protein n=1 Tax=Phytophthora pseudosyringae TaxID=221518 RepID=A0A8T1W500_9STRA|nr:hypothetical protein PHYPSEUDO_012724 [Phytophthora pseudosyringae]
MPSASPLRRQAPVGVGDVGAPSAGRHENRAPHCGERFQTPIPAGRYSYLRFCCLGSTAFDVRHRSSRHCEPHTLREPAPPPLCVQSSCRCRYPQGQLAGHRATRDCVRVSSTSRGLRSQQQRRNDRPTAAGKTIVASCALRRRARSLRKRRREPSPRDRGPQDTHRPSGDMWVGLPTLLPTFRDHARKRLPPPISTIRQAQRPAERAFIAHVPAWHALARRAMRAPECGAAAEMLAPMGCRQSLEQRAATEVTGKLLYR